MLGVRFLLWSCAALPADLSPLELHGRFLDLVIQGESTRPLALRWSRQSGDRSFDTFLEDSPPIREAMNLEQKALLSWDQGKHDEAVDLYRRAGGLLLLEKAFSEAAFCYYFIGELLAEEENIELSSQYLRAALSLAGTRSRPFLTGLIFQGLANNLWFSGHLDLSVWAFGEAESCWERIQFSHGHIAILHNLALLYRELGFQSTAQRYYERALERLEDTAEMPEISFQILAGFTKFLVGSGDREGALATLEKARRQPGEDPFELLLLEYAVNPGEATREALAGAAAPSARAAILRNLELVKGAPGGAGARGLLVEARQLASRIQSRFLRRRVEIEFGKWLERSQHSRLAEDSYRRALADAEVLTGDLLFPFSRMADPALDGLVRALINQDRWEEARSVIRNQLRRRLDKTVRALTAMEDSPRSADELSLLVEAAARPAAWGREPVPRAHQRDEPLPADTLEIELWPDGNRIYIWLRDHTRMKEHLTVRLSESVSSLVDAVVSPLYTTGQGLPPPPPMNAIRRLSRELIGPLQTHLQYPRLLFIPHKELQRLPFEMLLNRDGQLLLDEFFISYLPPTSKLRPAGSGTPLAVLPDLGLGHAMAARERFLFGLLFGDGNTSPHIAAVTSRESDWIHVSSHLSFDHDLWYRSRLSGEGAQLDLWQFLRSRFRSTLLSLSTCDAGNSHGWRTPFWMGIAGVLLERNTSALVLNRWKLDEASVEVYLEFAERVWQGASLDVALTQARRNFRRKVRTRGRVRLDLEHPFFWAGISYIGRPGIVLYPKREPIPWTVLLFPLLIPVFTLIERLVHPPRRAGTRPAPTILS